MRRLRRCSTVLLALVVAPAAFAALGAAPASAAGPDPVQAAAGWLTTQFENASHLPAPAGDHFDNKYGTSYYPNYGENADALFGLAAAHVGAAKARVALRYLDANLDAYADPTGAQGGPYDGSFAKVALAHEIAGTSATSLLTELKADECPAGSSTCTPGAPKNIFASASDAFVILAEARGGTAHAPSAAAVDYFLSLQCASGGFTSGTDPCGSGDADVDSTSYALMALQALGGHSAEIAKAADWLTGQRAAGGYWVSQDIPNTNSTGLAAAALAGADRDVTTSRSWLRGQQVPAGQPGAGALQYGGTFEPTTTSATSLSVLATAQGLIGLEPDGSLATVSAAGSTGSAPLLNPVAAISDRTIAPGQQVRFTGAAYAAGEKVLVQLENASVTTFGNGKAGAGGVIAFSASVPSSAAAGPARVVVTGTASGLTVSLQVTVSAAAAPPTDTAPGGPFPGSPFPGGPPLANTGSTSSGLVPVGLLAVALGALLVAVGRRQRDAAHRA